MKKLYIILILIITITVSLLVHNGSCPNGCYAASDELPTVKGGSSEVFEGSGSDNEIDVVIDDDPLETESDSSDENGLIFTVIALGAAVMIVYTVISVKKNRKRK